MAAPVEAKVKASGLAALAAGLIDWALAEYVFKGHHVDAAVTAEVYAAIPAVIATAAGYLAPHTPRPADAGVIDVAALSKPPVPQPQNVVASSGQVIPPTGAVTVQPPPVTQ